MTTTRQYTLVFPAHDINLEERRVQILLEGTMDTDGFFEFTQKTIDNIHYLVSKGGYLDIADPNDEECDDNVDQLIYDDAEMRGIQIACV